MKNIFISHSWKETNESDYKEVKNLLLNKSYFNFKDYSVESIDPLQGDVWEQINTKIKYSTVVLITAGVYVTYSDSIKREIKIAKNYQKPIIAIKSRSNSNISSYVRDNVSSENIVNYNTESIVNAIRGIK